MSDEARKNSLPVTAVTPEVVTKKSVVEGASFDPAELTAQLRQTLGLDAEYFDGKRVEFVIEPVIVPVQYAVMSKVCIAVSRDKP